MTVLLTLNNGTQIDPSGDWEVYHSTVNGRKINIAKKQERLISRYDGDNGIRKECFIGGTSTPPTVREISGIFNCKVVLEAQNTLTFTYPQLTGLFADKEISLVCGRANLVWQVFDTTLNEALQVTFEHTMFSKRCSEETRIRITAERTKSVAEQALFFKDFKVLNLHDPLKINRELIEIKENRKEINRDLYPIKHSSPAMLFAAASLTTAVYYGVATTFGPLGLLSAMTAASWVNLILDKPKYENLEKLRLENARLEAPQSFLESLPVDNPFAVEIEPISAPSKLDPRVLVSKFMWAVTLITYNGSWGNHAEICIEGIKNDRSFATVAHFTGSDVRAPIIPVDGEIKLVSRSEIWMRTSEKVQKMLDVIEQEKNMIKQGILVLPYAKLGQSSFVRINDEWRGGEPNCLDWVRDKLIMVDIELDKSAFENIAALARLYTHKPNWYVDKPVSVSI